jgi:hypothetical protein
MRLTSNRVSCISSLLWTSIVELLRLIKGTFIIGSSHAFFSLANPLSPTIGKIGGMRASIGVFLWRTIITLSITSYQNFLLVYHIPTFCGALYYKRNPFLTSFLIASCFLAFLVHPIGWKAGLYSLYWFIPIATTLFPHDSIFLDALGSTFTVHAVGSVFWLYTHPTMTAASWLSLIPLVAAERLIFAFGMTLIIHGWHMVQELSLLSTWTAVRCLCERLSACIQRV